LEKDERPGEVEKWKEKINKKEGGKKIEDDSNGIKSNRLRES